MMNLDTVYDWLKAATSYDATNIIRESGIGPVPTGPFLTFGLVSVSLPDFEYKTNKVAYDELDEIDDDHVTTHIYTRATYMIAVNAYSRNGFSDLSSLKLSTHNPTIRDILNDANVSIVGMSDIRDLTALGDTVHRDRFQADFSFKSNAIEEFTVDKLNEYLIGGEMGFDMTLEIPKE